MNVLFLARIIPSPKKFMYQFNEQGMLKTLPKKQETYLTNLMLRRGYYLLEIAFINLATLQSLVLRVLSIKN
jgi:hypothetical protein